MTDDDETHDDDDDDVQFVGLSNVGAICLTIAFVMALAVSFGSCLYHCENQADRKLRCVELTHDLDRCSESFQGTK